MKGYIPGHHRWTDDESATLRCLYKKHTAVEIADIMNMTVSAIQNKAHKLGLRKGPINKINLTTEQRIWLRREYPHMCNEICAMHLGVSMRTVIRMARAFGLHKTPQFMRESQVHAARKAKESHLRNGTYPPKGVVNNNIKKGIPYRFRSKVN